MIWVHCNRPREADHVTPNSDMFSYRCLLRGSVALWQAEGEEDEDFSGLHFTLKNMPAILENTGDITYKGNIRSDATECVVSFPGKFASGWDALIEEHQEQSVACVFLCTPEDGLGEHSTDPEAPSETCYCRTIYGERSFREFGYLQRLPKECSHEDEERARQKAKHTKTVVVREDADPQEMLKAERQAEEAWERSGRTASWGCRWFEVWKEKVHEAVGRGQTLKVVFFPGQVGMGRVAWNDLCQPDVDPWDGVGCGGSQKCEIAYLNKMRDQSPGKGWEYIGVDVIIYLKEEFKAGKLVLARDGGQWRRGTLLSCPELKEQQSTKSGKIKMEWTTRCQVECLETKKCFSSECVRPADGTDEIWRLLDTVGKDVFCEILTENLPEGAALGEDAEFIFPDGTHAIQFAMKDPTIKAMQKLRDQILNNEFEVAINKGLLSKKYGCWQVQVDKTYFCTQYEKKLLRFRKPTEHQKKILKEVKQSSNIHISAIAGAGKTFIAVKCVTDRLLNTSSGLILYVAPCESLCLFFVHWVARRVQGRGSLREKFSIQSTLDRIRVMVSPYKDVMSVHVTGNCVEFKSISQLSMVKENFLLAIVDEAHDIYREGVDHAFLEDLQAEGRILLSNLSQSSADQQLFPDMPIVKLTEVVRSTKRIVAGTAAFLAAALEREGITSLCTAGPPLKTFLFMADKENQHDAMNGYIKHTVKAIRHLLRTYMRLRLHNRLALIVPDNEFLMKFKPSLQSALKDQPLRSQLQFASFEESLSLLPPDLLPTDQQAGLRELPRDLVDTIVLDQIENCKGLENLMVISIGLDAPINLEAGDMLTRAHIYQALKRAQLHAVVVNEYVQNGWLEFLGMLKFKEHLKFTQAAALEETKSISAAKTLTQVQHSVKQGRAAALQPEKSKQAIQGIQANQGAQFEPEALPTQPDVQGRSLPETKVQMMASSVWDTGDNDDSIATRINELRFDPRCEKAGCGGFLGWENVPWENDGDGIKNNNAQRPTHSERIPPFSGSCLPSWKMLQVYPSSTRTWAPAYDQLIRRACKLDTHCCDPQVSKWMLLLFELDWV